MLAKTLGTRPSIQFGHPPRIAQLLQLRHASGERDVFCQRSRVKSEEMLAIVLAERSSLILFHPRRISGGGPRWMTKRAQLIDLSGACYIEMQTLYWEQFPSSSALCLQPGVLGIPFTCAQDLQSPRRHCHCSGGTCSREQWGVFERSVRRMPRAKITLLLAAALMSGATTIML